jgi:peroxiredoxin
MRSKWRDKVSLSDFIGKRLILFFYPQAGTPTCTVEACNLRDHFSVIEEKGVHGYCWRKPRRCTKSKKI